MSKKIKKKKSKTPIFPPELSELERSPSLQDPSIAAALSSGFAGLDSVGSINEEIKLLFPENQEQDFEAFLDTIRKNIWSSFDIVS